MSHYNIFANYRYVAMNSKILFKGLYKYFFLLLLSVAIFAGCKKNSTDFDTSSSLYFSTDTITFDTVFTTIGSSTEYFMIYNQSNKPVNISKIYLAGGAGSNFRINIDGLTGSYLQDLEIEPNDSLFAFVEVTVDPNGLNTPLLITDSLIFETNGHVQDIDLVAYGQDAYFIIADHHVNGLPPYKIVAGEGVDTTWDNAKPIVVYGYAIIDSTATLRITKGTNIYFHSNSGLWSYIGGNLIVTGTKDEPVIFQGDRLEAVYQNIPGQWDRIWINESSKIHKIDYAIIRNGFIGIQSEILGGSGLNCQIQIQNTKIENMSGAGILSRTSIIDGYNLLISNCQQYAAALTMGGLYQFIHSTFANYWSGSVRQTPAVYLNNYFMDGKNVVYPFALVQADFVNCIIYGNLENEFLPDSVQGAAFEFHIRNSFIKTNINTQSTSRFSSVFKNTDPLFIDYYNNDYHLDAASSAFSKGKPTSVLFDLDGEARDALTPTPGAYEKQGSL